MAQITLNSTGVASSGSLVLQSNGTTTAVTVDASQNVGIGISSPSARIDAYGDGTNPAGIFRRGGAYGNIESTDTARTAKWTLGRDNASTGNFVIAYNDATKVSMDTSGNLGIGTTSATEKLHVAGALRVTGAQTTAGTGVYLDYGSGIGSVNVYGPDASTQGIWRVYTATSNGGTGSEKARIDSSGNLLVGTTSAFNSTSITQISGNPASNQVLSVRHTGAAPNGMYLVYTGATPNGGANYFILASDGTTRFLVASNGGIGNYSGNNVNLSDRREKTNFSPATSYLDKICAIPVQTFNYIDQNLEEDGGLTLGVVAQDVQAVAPELVMESNWANKDEEPKMRLSIYQTDLQYALMKCIQEQQALITQLQADVAALKA